MTVVNYLLRLLPKMRRMTNEMKKYTGMKMRKRMRTRMRTTTKTRQRMCFP
jgi:hypothetical protein